jgi:hypothetical protein
VLGEEGESFVDFSHHFRISCEMGRTDAMATQPCGRNMRVRQRPTTRSTLPHQRCDAVWGGPHAFDVHTRGMQRRTRFFTLFANTHHRKDPHYSTTQAAPFPRTEYHTARWQGCKLVYKPSDVRRARTGRDERGREGEIETVARRWQRVVISVLDGKKRRPPMLGWTAHKGTQEQCSPPRAVGQIWWCDRVKLGLSRGESHGHVCPR